ncbi:MAG: PAS domain S-box protein [Pseudomonadota bacterium]
MPDEQHAFRSLPLRLSLPLMVFSAFLLMTVLTLVLSHRANQAELASNVELRANIQSARMAVLATPENLATRKDIRREIEMLMARGDISAVALTDPKHKIVVAHRSDWVGMDLPAVVPQLGSVSKITALELRWSDDRRQLDILLPYRFTGAQETAGLSDNGLVYIHADIGRQVDASFQASMRNHLVILMAGLLFALILYVWLRHVFVRPVEQLVMAARRIGSGYLDTAVDISSSPELGTLASDLNAMADNLRASQEVLRIKEERLRLMGDNLPDSYVYQVEHDPSGASRFTYLSSGAERIHGIGAAAIMNNAQLLYAQIHPDDVAGLLAAEKTSQENLSNFSEVVRIRHPDDGLRWLHIRSHPSRYDDGTLVWDGVATDVTPLKLVELDLQNALVASERFREALDHVNAFVYMKDRESRYFYANRRTLELFGCTQQELTGTADDRFFPPDTVRRMREIDLRVLAGENTAEEVEAVMPDGIRHVYWEVKSPIYIHNTRGEKEIWGISGISTDITKHKELEESLTYLTRRGQSLLELPKLADALDEQTFMQRGLEMAEELTDSRISFIHFVNDDEEAIELVTWSRRTLETYCRAAFDRHYPISQAGIWAEALRKKQPVVFNDYATAEGKRGLPAGHAALDRLISLPIIEHGKVVMLAGVGNKPWNYSERDIETVQLIANEIWRLVQRGRNQHKIERFNRMIERSLNEIYTFDAATLRFIDANQGARTNIGYSLDELRAMHPVDIKPQMTPEQFEQLIEPLRSGKERIVEFSTRHRRKDGTEYDADIHIELTDDSNPIFVVAVRDITQRRKEELELRQALQVVEASPVVSFRWLAKEGWPVDYVSQNVSRWGYRPEDIRAGNPAYADIIHPDDLQRVSNEVALHSFSGSPSYTQSYRIRRADGRYFWVEDNTRVVRDEHGNLVAYEGVVTDVDVQKSYEQELAANLADQKALNKKLEAAQNQLLQSEKMASIGQLAAGVAHELNNPIGFVNSNLGTLDNYLHDLFAILNAYGEAEVAAGPQCPQLDHVHAMKRDLDYDYLRTDIYQLMAESKDGLARVAKIVRDLKDFSRAGDTAMQWANLHQGLDSTLNIVWNELKYKCTVTKHYGELPQVWCEPSQLNQVFMNLLVNAGHAIPDKGEISITTGCRGDEVFVAIADTGTGIAPENLNRIFDPFFTTKPVGKGTGLGLSLAYSIVQKHKGRIEVQSEPGKGSTFTVWLPINPPAHDSSAVLPAPTLEQA